MRVRRYLPGLPLGLLGMAALAQASAPPAQDQPADPAAIPDGPRSSAARFPVRTSLVTSVGTLREPLEAGGSDGDDAAALALPAVEVGPARGPVGVPIRLRLNRDLAAAPLALAFHAGTPGATGTPVRSRLVGGGMAYQTPAPMQLCGQGVATWDTELLLANGESLGIVGHFTPTNCAR